MNFDFQSKVQKHQAFEAEIAANEDRVMGVINVGKGKICTFTILMISYILIKSLKV